MDIADRRDSMKSAYREATSADIPASREKAWKNMGEHLKSAKQERLFMV